METKPVKVTFNMSPEVLERLKLLAKERSTTVTKVVRDAISTELFITKEVQNHNKVLIQDINGKMKEIIFRR